VIVGFDNVYLNTEAFIFLELTVTDTSNGALISVTTALDANVQVICLLSGDAIGFEHSRFLIVTNKPKL